jgi:hypothetical protein
MIMARVFEAGISGEILKGQSVLHAGDIMALVRRYQKYRV